MPQSKLYRQNVVAIVKRTDGRILIGLCHRGDYSEWQLPQGGVNEGETVEVALHREVEEETSLKGLKILSQTQKEIKYDWLEPKKKNGLLYAGQSQVYFVVEVTSTQSPKASDEFEKFEWVTAKEVLARAIPMRRPVYERAFQELKLI